MTTAVEQLTSLQEAADCFDIEPSTLLRFQLEAADERLQQQRARIPLLRVRARSAGVPNIRHRDELLPLLFPHTAYRSYDDAWLTDGRWGELADWLDVVSAHDLRTIDLRGVASLEDFVDRLAAHGCYLFCSNGVTGQSSLITSSASDLAMGIRGLVRGMTWATGIAPAGDRTLFSIGPRARLIRNEKSRSALMDAFCRPGSGYDLRVPAIGVTSIARRASQERRISEGIADRAELTAFDTDAIDTWTTMEEAMDAAAHALVAARRERLLLGGTFARLFQAASGVRAKNFAAEHFRPDNAIISGGLKDDTLPPDYREFICGTFNVAPERVFVHYSMHELNTSFPQCRARRYHVAPWVMVLPLDEAGENVVSGSGEIEGRAAFVDLSVAGHWGGVISGDLIGVEFGACPCGRRGVTIGEDIVRYANLLGGDDLRTTG
jgi:hypothetical protein